MEKVARKKKRRHPIRNLPLKWSVMLYVILCAVFAIGLSLSIASIFTNLQSELYYSYEMERIEEWGIARDELNDDMLEDEAILISRSIYDLKMLEEDAKLYELYGQIAIISVPVISLLCVLLTGIIFYNRKLRQPLQLIDVASARIAAGDLDFSIAYDNRNEMGQLASSLETMRAALQENNQEMWRMMEQRKQLNAAFAHDLRTPLTVLRGYVEYLRTYVPQGRVSEEKLLDRLGMMHAYVTRLEGYTASMSTVQRLEEAQPVPQDVSMAALGKRLQAAADMLRGPHRLRFDRAGGDAVLHVDPDLIGQVLENLVSNAARYAASEICVALSLDGPVLRLTVTDDGPGFSRRTLDKGLVPYNHSKDENVASDHYGLGLYICAVLCARHGGALILPQAEGQSTVTATFHSL